MSVSNIYKNIKTNKLGFNLIEILVVVAIFIIILTSAVTLVNTTASREDLDAKSREVIEFLAQARNYSVTGYFGDVWGIKVLDNNSYCDNSGDCIVLYKGKYFDLRNSSYDRILQLNLNSGVYIDSDQVNEFYFDFKSGWLSTSTASNLAEQAIVLKSTFGEEKTIQIAPTGLPYVFVCGENYVYDVEGQAYRTVQIGTQCWMAENLNTGTMLASAATDPTDNGQIEKWCYDNNSSNCDNTGGLYLWDEAMGWVTTEGAQGACPAGWHVPSAGELSSLVVLYSPSTAGTDLKENGASGFEWMLAGEMNGDSDVFDSSTYGILYSSTEEYGTFADIFYVSSGSATVVDDMNTKTYGFSIRCLKD